MIVKFDEDGINTKFRITLLVNNPALCALYIFRNPTPALFSDRYTFCQKCFNDISGDTVSLGDDPSQPLK